MQFINTLVSGLTLGVVYGAFALALVMIWRSTRIVNFAQAPMAMVSTYVALTLIDAGMHYALAVGVALISGFAFGILVERILIRRLPRDSEISPVIVTLGLFVALHSVAALVFGPQLQSFPAPFGVRGVAIGDTRLPITGFGIFTVVAVAVTMAALILLFRFTDVGLKMRAAAFSPDHASLLGVKVSSMLALGWGLAGAVGALSGVLVAGGNLMYPAYMDAIVVYGFAAAVLGGLDSPMGAVVGGLVMGVIAGLVGGYLGYELVALAALVVLVSVLLVKPGGLFSTTQVRSV